jgi:hypothetical protein
VILSLESKFPAKGHLLAHRDDDGVDWIQMVFKVVEHSWMITLILQHDGMVGF